MWFRMLLLISSTARSEEEPWVFLKTWLWTCSPFVFVLGMRGAALALPRVTVVPSGGVGKALGLRLGNTDLCALCPCHILLLDFLPLKCDACEQIFCTDHIAYAQHSCTSAYKKVSADSRSHPPSCMELLSFSSHWS